jgi:hypothetical protein
LIQREWGKEKREKRGKKRGKTKGALSRKKAFEV